MSASSSPSATPHVTTAAYYFPGFHVDPRNEKDMGPGFTEWKLIRESKPRFEGHRQPKVPLWGHRDEALPAVMEQNIDAAADHGLDCFLFDWYWYEDQPFLQRSLEEGFLGAANVSRMKFALMWANHDWVDIFPRGFHKESPLLHPGGVTAPVFSHMVDYAIEHYFHHPSYWKIDGKPYFSIFQIDTFLNGIGGLDNARKAIDEFRAKVEKAGFPGLHLNGVSNLWGPPLLPGEPAVRDQTETMKVLRFDSLTAYGWPTLHEKDFPTTDYLVQGKKAREKWDEIANAYDVPFFPTVTTGWDFTPRCRQDGPFEFWEYPFMPVCRNNSVEELRKALADARDWVLRRPGNLKFITINAWNEWTEGSYLEPDEEYGMGRLEALASVFKR